MKSKQSIAPPPPYAPNSNNANYPVQETLPLLQHQYSSHQATSPPLVHSPSMANSPSSFCPDPNLQYFEPIFVAPSCKFSKTDNNSYRITIYNHAHSQISQQLTAHRKVNKRIKASKISTLGLSNRISVTITTQTSNDLIKIQRDAFGKRFTVKSPHNSNHPIGSIEPNFMKTEFKLFVHGREVTPVITMNVSGVKFLCMDKKFEFFKAGTDTKIGSMENDGVLKFDRDFPSDARVKTLALCTGLLYKLLD